MKRKKGITLKPCPFCGNEKIHDLWMEDNFKAFVVHHKIQCGNCGISTMFYTKKEQAISAWNRREREQ